MKSLPTAGTTWTASRCDTRLTAKLPQPPQPLASLGFICRSYCRDWSIQSLRIQRAYGGYMDEVGSTCGLRGRLKGARSPDSSRGLRTAKRKLAMIG